jgi:hypothetical protein
MRYLTLTLLLGFSSVSSIAACTSSSLVAFRDKTEKTRYGIVNSRSVRGERA